MAENRFPFPFMNSVFQYTNNLRPLDPPQSLQITSDYSVEVELKRQLLAKNPARCYQSLANTLEAQWEVLDHLLHELAEVYPQYFRLCINGSEWTFSNFLLQETTRFEFGQGSSLDLEPLDFVGRQVQEDLILMSQVDDVLYLSAGQLCFPSNWSLTFNLGMPFENIHRPVPGIVQDGLVNKIQRFLTRIEAGKPWTRLNWSLNAGRRLDTAAETFDEWGSSRYHIDSRNVGREVFLRVEEQNLVRMPGSNGLLFTIHTYLKPVEEVSDNASWCQQFYNVLHTLPPEISQYKGIEPFYGTLVAYLAERLTSQQNERADINEILSG